MPNQCSCTNNGKDLKNFPWLTCLDLGLDVVDLTACHARKSTSRHVLLHQCILLIPLLAKPEVESLGVFKGNIAHSETAPMKVDRLGRASLEVCADQAKVLFTESTSPTFVGQSTVFMLCNRGFRLRLTGFPHTRLYNRRRSRYFPSARSNRRTCPCFVEARHAQGP